MAKPAPSAKRQAAEAKGRKAELAAATALRLKGFKILGSRVKTPVGEIDLVARRGRLLIFVEVKARQQHSDGLEAITPHQQARILAAAEAFLAQHPQYADLDMRFDAVICCPGRLPHHLADAWRP